MYRKLKKQVYILMHPISGNTRWDKLLNVFLVLLIVLNVIAVILETEHELYVEYKTYFDNFDLFSVIIFSIEYVLRVWSATQEKRYHHWFWGRLRYIFTPAALIDLLAILPFYLHALFVLDLRVLRLLRLLRFLRIFRLTSYMSSAKVLTNVFKNKAQELLISLILTIGLIILSSCIMYFAEHPAQPDKFSSIPATLWWSVVTLTTIGYGDMIPVTLVGKFFTAVIALTGVALLALPAGIITAGFIEEMRKARKPKTHTCPNCGFEIVDHDHEHH
jgi:voltage-gated potassium channel